MGIQKLEGSLCVTVFKKGFKGTIQELIVENSEWSREGGHCPFQCKDEATALEGSMDPLQNTAPSFFP